MNKDTSERAVPEKAKSSSENLQVPVKTTTKQWQSKNCLLHACECMQQLHLKKHSE
ncbi:MAG: hypothetical protein ABL925_10645 [Methylococcales bacterium]